MASSEKRSKKNKFEKDYEKIMEQSSSFHFPVVSNTPEWKSVGDTFVKFSLYDENQRSIATTDTCYIL
jgi:hypothetical protein